MKTTRVLLSALALSAACPAFADDIRCGNLLVSSGDTGDRVRERCGAPAQIRVERKLVPAVIWRDGRRIELPGGDREVIVEFWTYNFGPDRLMRQLKLEDGVVVEIKTLGYGHHKT